MGTRNTTKYSAFTFLGIMSTRIKRCSIFLFPKMAPRRLALALLRYGNNAARQALSNVKPGDFWRREGHIGAQIQPDLLSIATNHNRLQNGPPAIGAVDVDRTEGTAFEVAELVAQTADGITCS